MADLHYRVDPRDALLIPLHLRHIPDAEFPGGLADAGFIANQDDFNAIASEEFNQIQ